MDGKRILRLKKRRLVLNGNEEIALVATTIKDIPAASSTDNNFKRTTFNIHRPAIPLKRDATSSTPTILNISRSNSPFYQITPQVPKIVGLTETEFHDMVKRLGGPSLGKTTANAIKIEDVAATDNVNAHIRVGGVFSSNEMNELLTESETSTTENRERDESNDHEYAFGRAIALMLKHIEDVDSKLQVETKIFSIICKELERKC